MAELDLDAIRARCNSATPGPWTAVSVNGRKSGIALVGALALRGTGKPIAVLAGIDVPQRHRDAEFVAHAREDMPALLAEVVRLTAALEWAQPVLDAAHAWLRAPGTEAHNLAAAVTAHKSTSDSAGAGNA
jgi:hypothetical protein